MNDKTKEQKSSAVTTAAGQPCNWQVNFKYINKNALLRQGTVVIFADDAEAAKNAAQKLLDGSDFDHPRVVNAKPY